WRQIPRVKILLLDLTRVDSIDSPALDGFERMSARLEKAGVDVLFTGVAPDSRIRRQLMSRDEKSLMFFDLDSALEAAEDNLLFGDPVGKRKIRDNISALLFHQLDVACDLDDAERQHLQALMSQRSCDTGQCICRKGDAAAE